MPPFEETFQARNKMFDELVTLIESLDVEPILSAPPVREDIEYPKENFA